MLRSIRKRQFTPNINCVLQLCILFFYRYFFSENSIGNIFDTWAHSRSTSWESAAIERRRSCAQIRFYSVITYTMQIWSIINGKLARDTPQPLIRCKRQPEPQLAFLSGRKACLHDREIGYRPVENVMQTASFYPSTRIIILHELGMLGWGPCLGGLRLQYTLWGPGLFSMRD